MRVRLLLAVLVLVGTGCGQIIGLADYTLCGPVGNGGCGGAGGGEADAGLDAPG